VVGADGIRSTVRALVLTAAGPCDLGAMNWRSIAPIRPAGLTEMQMHLGVGCMFGLVPVGGERTYGFADVIQPRFRDPLEGRLQRLRDRFATFGSRVQDIFRRSSVTTRSFAQRWNGWSPRNGIAAGWFWSGMPPMPAHL
jgi:2-polyprenyl-6-methoxyphenol hydroxylase-like FAD-dependent oxidoreductase